MTADTTLVPVNGTGKTVEDKLARYAPDGAEPRQWLYLIKTQIMGVDKRGQERPTEDMLLFLYTCNRLKLDPLARQIYAVYRWDSKLGREKMSIQVSIDGMRLIAERTGRYGGQDDVRFDPVDESSDLPRKATVTVYKLNPVTGERMPTTKSARWSEYAADSPMWRRMPYLMLGKCAEALALRAAFPQELSGVYTAEEMAQADRRGDVPTIEGEVIEEKPAQALPSASVAIQGQASEPALSEPPTEPLAEPDNAPAPTAARRAPAEEDDDLSVNPAANRQLAVLRPPRNIRVFNRLCKELADADKRFTNRLLVLEAAEDAGVYPLPEAEAEMVAAFGKIKAKLGK